MEESSNGNGGNKNALDKKNPARLSAKLLLVKISY